MTAVPAVAVLSWVVTLTVGVLIVHGADMNPLTTTGVLLPLAIGAVGGVLLFALALGVRSPAVVGVAAGAFAGWVGLTIAAALVGTPYGYGRLEGDAGRMSALVMHFSTTWHPTDAADPHLAPEYPPLYPMVIGRVAAITGRDGWTLLRPAEAVVTSFAVLAAFLLWRRLTSDVVALLASTTVIVALAEPSKANEILAIAVFLPWLMGTFAVAPAAGVGPPEQGELVDPVVPGDPVVPRRLHPLLGGVIIGLLVPWSPNMLFLSIFGVAAVIGYALWRSADRRQQLIDLAITVGVGILVASWYIVPLAIAYAGSNIEVVADTWLSGSLVDAPLSVVGTPSLLMTLLQVVGLVGVAVYLRRTWWAPPFALLLAGVLAFRAVMELRFVIGGHSFMLLYVAAQLRYVLCVAGLLTLAELWRSAVPRMVTREVPVRLVGLVLAAVVVGTVGSTGWQAWAPAPRGLLDTETPPASPAYNSATYAHAEPLPSGRKVRYPAPRQLPGLPVDRIVSFVHRSLGPRATPDTISYSQILFSFHAWPNWLPPDRQSSSALTQWDYRHQLLKNVATNTDPAAMAEALRTIPYGPVDALVLKAGTGGWYFADIRFTPSAFAGPQFAVSSELPHGYYVVVRLPH